MRMHADQLTVPPVTVRVLVDSRFPEWRGPAVRPIASHGTVNAIFRLGDDLAARFPPPSPRGPGLRRGGAGARPGVGLRAGDGPGLVLPGQQSADEPDGP